MAECYLELQMICVPFQAEPSSLKQHRNKNSFNLRQYFLSKIISLYISQKGNKCCSQKIISSVLFPSVIRVICELGECRVPVCRGDRWLLFKKIERIMNPLNDLRTLLWQWWSCHLFLDMCRSFYFGDAQHLRINKTLLGNFHPSGKRRSTTILKRVLPASGIFPEFADIINSLSAT